MPGIEITAGGLEIFPDIQMTAVVYFYQDNAPAAQAAVALTCLGDAVRTGFPMDRAGSVVGIVVNSNEARTVGTLTVDATIAGSVTGLQAVLDGTNTTVHYATQASGLDTFSAGQAIGVKITTSGDWAPITADVIIGVAVRY